MKYLVLIIALASLTEVAHARGYGYHSPSSTSTYRYTAPKSSGYGTGSSPYHERVNGYQKHDGTYVQPHMRTQGNSTQYDNFNTRGNYTPYTGKYGSKTPKY
ncbi:hypothetical protein [Pantoea sp. BL1]|uniref:hypothetical protein n=1 Tax=Pantoea sp. BL1 TaxID=1628190 RepID=UPI0009080E3A|nr:hypothetical protein [Pantoea sp. BL1]